MFKNAIVRQPCPEMIHGLTSAFLGLPDYRMAFGQHLKYIETLRSCGLDVLVLEADSRFPDSTFVEDVAICTQVCAIVTNPGAPSRNGERLEMKGILQSYYDIVETIKSPGTLDAGDVMMTGEKVPLTRMLHLKSGASYLEQDHMLVSDEFKNHPAFKRFQKINVDPEESYAANSLWINGTVLIPSGFPKTRDKIERAGFRTISLDVTEFEKLDGGLSCLSLRF